MPPRNRPRPHPQSPRHSCQNSNVAPDLLPGPWDAQRMTASVGGQQETRMPIRPRRSVLYMPGSNARALEKAKTLAADGVILDLEDAVAPDAKVAARASVAAAVKAGGFGAREGFIRTNRPETPGFADDLHAALAAAPHASPIPTIYTSAQ